MVFRGHVENGVIRLESPLALPEGAEVEVRLLQGTLPRQEETKIPNLYEQLKDFVGKAEGLPPDASVNLDHYLYGLPKQQ